MPDVGRALAIEYEPRLVEDAVLAAVRGRAEEPAFRAGRDALYAVVDPDGRETRFRALHAAWFERLGLGDEIARAVREQPSVETRATRCVVALARSRHDEGADLLVAPGHGTAEPTGRTVVLRLRPETLGDRVRLRALCRHELLHIADLLDPRFGYTPRALGAGSGPCPEPLLRERYRVLWDAAVDGRLHRLGWAAPGTRDARLAEFAATFPMLGDRTAAAFERFFAGTAHTHADLVAFAAAPGPVSGPERRGAGPGERCPLCGCPTHAFERAPDRLPRPARERIRQSFPAWEPADGLCRQCADLYGALAGPGDGPEMIEVSDE